MTTWWGAGCTMLCSIQDCVASRLAWDLWDPRALWIMAVCACLQVIRLRTWKYVVVCLELRLNFPRLRAATYFSVD